MPYKSKAQQGLFHSPNSPVSKAKVAEFDKASKGLKLPDKVLKPAGRPGASADHYAPGAMPAMPGKKGKK